MENPPLYIETHMQNAITNNARKLIFPKFGERAYNVNPSMKKIAYVTLRPITSENEAHIKRPEMLNTDKRPVNPAAIVAIWIF
ncbi:MAG: hypothetical protein GX846_00490 [Deltaproteobacteria bacterium]|nr:hypothetical protein [Deltaproteobacteria bacterium]